MRASQNELRSLFRQAFEACGYDFGRYEVAAELVVWSQMHGLNVFSKVKEYMLPLVQESMSVKVLLDEPQKLVFDNQGHSVLVNGLQIVNLASAKALDQGCCLVQVQNCPYPIMITKLLCGGENHGLYAQAYWWDTETEKTIEFRSNTHQDCPEFLYYSNVNNLNDGELNIIFAKHEIAEDSKLAVNRAGVFKNARLDNRLIPEYFEKQYQQSLEHGIEIESAFWRQLIEIGSSVLVESNEQSRLGAGD